MIDPMLPLPAPAPFPRRHPVLTLAVALCGAWLLLDGWVVTVSVVAALILLASLRRRRRARTIAHAGLRARADLEHRYALNGDPRGIYGRYPPWYFAEQPQDRTIRT
ncbi:MAG: hypothetical protein K0R68_2218 [Mycobacterium sp.]|jgi:hypothetical protein|nr:hypothetical protein [Mycobacterium sp.]